MRLAKLLMLSATIATATLGAAMAGEANANTLNTAIAPMPLNRALEQYAKQTGLQVVYVSATATGVKSSGAAAGLTRDAALRALLSGTGLESRFIDSNTVTITKAEQHAEIIPIQIAQAAPARPAVETVTVTSSKLGGADVQSIPIAITALSQEQLTATQTAGGPDLVKQVPNLTFTKTNFAGYSIQIRGIGTQAISVATDPAVAVALNDIPFIRNHFFEQEFFDLGQVEVLRGPQGTLYGRNATAGVVNLTTAKPTDQFEAMASAEIGNYQERRFEGMINLPIVDDRLDIRLAGEWTKRNGYSLNEFTGKHIDGRDLWSGRLSIAFRPTENLQATFVWEHFSEDDDRLRSGKQLCKNQPTPTEVGGVPVWDTGNVNVYGNQEYLGQGCEQVSLYSPDALQVPNGATLPYYTAIVNLGLFGNGSNPYEGSFQNPNLRVIDSQLEPSYRAKNDILELNTDYNITPALTFTSQTGFNHDFLYSTEDFNRFVSQPGIFTPNSNGFGGMKNIIDSNGVFCDPQLGCSDRLLAMDLNEERSWQLSQEFRLASHLSGPFNFSIGGNYLHYETEENYYVFINTLSIFAAGSSLDVNGNYAQHCTGLGGGLGQVVDPNDPRGFLYNCVYMDPNPIGSLNNKGHNYFLNQNPYLLNSYAAFGEAYYDVTKDLKLTAGLRFTEDQKHFTDIPTEILIGGAGYAVSDVIDQTWDQFTGRAAVNWTPKLSFTDQTLFYGSYAHGYKAGGANPPGALLPDSQSLQPTHPLTFKPEFIDAFELGTKNTLLDGALTFNGSLFYYNYENYQISQIVDRTAVNLNFDAHVKGAELEATWEPIPGLRFNASGGWEDATIAKGSKAIDIMDRTAGDPDWIVIKPWPTQASNCIIPTYVIAAYMAVRGEIGNGIGACAQAYNQGVDPVAVRGAPPGYPGWDPSTAPNGGAGIDKELGGNKLPNTPPLTASFGAQYSVPLSSDWAGTFRTDYYWQDYSWARVYNDNPYDRLRGYTNVNFSLIFTNQNGWQVMGYLKNAFNTTAITGAFLNSDDTLLTTNVFLTDPRLLGIRLTKNW